MFLRQKPSVKWSKDMNRQLKKKKRYNVALKLMKRCSPHSWKEKCQLRVHQNAIRHYQDCQNLKRMAILSHGKALGKQELSYIASENVNWYNHYWRVFGSNYHNYIHIYLWSRNLLWGPTPTSVIWKYTYTRLFIDVSFVVENHWKQSKYQFTEE